MSAAALYQQIQGLIGQDVDPRVDQSSLERLSGYVTGMLFARNGSPAQVAKALAKLKFNAAAAESRERQIRRMENDPEVRADYCLYPLVRAALSKDPPPEVLLILDPTLQEDRVVMVSVNLWYRGRSLPLAWTIWPANRPLQGAGFWERIAGLLDQVTGLIPQGISVTVVADRAFGTPAFTDLVAARNWQWLVRVQDQTVYRDGQGQEGQIGQLVSQRNHRKKLQGAVFKKAGWRTASVVVYWGRRHKKPLCLVSSRPPDWHLVACYRRRFPIEGTFRDYKGYGWRWEQGQVTDLTHLERLLVGMAIATWIALMIGTWRAAQLLQIPPTGKRHTRPWLAKLSLFQLGLDLLQDWFLAETLPHFHWFLTDWNAPNWSDQLRAHHARAFVFAL